MISRFVARVRIASRRPLRVFLAFVILVGSLVDSASALDFSVGARETIYTRSQRTSRNLSTWPDGNFGVLPLGNGLYEFYAANGSKPVKTTGTLTTPGAGKKSVSITNVPSGTYNYVSGGPVYKDPASGARLMIYHAEKHGSSAKDFYSVLGMAVSTDVEGRIFRDLGTIVEPNMQVGQTEVNGGSFTIVNGQMHVYYRDWFPNGTTSELAVARAPISQVVSNALSGIATPFTKYYNGGWTQPGRGGLSSALEIGNPSNAWTTVSYNDYLNQLVMVSSQWSAAQPDLYMSTSPDGINWSPRQAVVTDVGEQFYPTLIGTGADPQHTGKSFYVYYTDSLKGAWSRWSDAKLVRREITLDPAAPNVLPITSPGGTTSPPSPQQNGWAQISDFRSDFQTGSPGAGWKYVWNPTGVVGNQSAFMPLAWSNSAQTYNTTGGATPVPAGSTTHQDDYLSLSAFAGHPGQPKYFPIAGYTIQSEDGAGVYRLAESSISKNDGVLSSREDGLGVMVYVNNSKIGSTQSVLTSGALASFNRDLGQLNVGDTVWVMVDPLKNQLYDSFINFDFSIQKSSPVYQSSAASYQMLSSGAVPEPSSALVLLIGLAGYAVRRPRRRAA